MCDGWRQHLEAINLGRRLVHAGVLLPDAWILAALVRCDQTVCPHKAVGKHRDRAALILLVTSLA
jgi:hypothetical protein